MTPEELLTKYDYNDEFVDMAALARKLNFDVSINNSLKDLGFMLIGKEDNIRSIMLTNKQSKESLRFVIAYLIAAYIEKGNDEKFAVRANFKELNKKENQDLIDYAIEILLPDKLLDSKISNLTKFKAEDFQLLKKEASVPDMVLEKKLKKIGGR